MKKVVIISGVVLVLFVALVTKQANEISKLNDTEDKLKIELKDKNKEVEKIKTDLSIIKDAQIEEHKKDKEDNGISIINVFLDTMFNFSDDPEGQRLNELDDIISEDVKAYLNPEKSQEDSLDTENHTPFSNLSSQLSDVSIYKGTEGYLTTFKLNYTFGDNEKLEQDMTAKFQVLDNQIVSYEVLNAE